MNVNYLKERRQALRTNLTTAEAKLWNELKNSKLKNRKIRRQHSISNYIVDFYCPSNKIVIELDGQGHFDAQNTEYDAKRDAFLKDLGLTVLRFENKFVFSDMVGVLNIIESYFISG